EGVGVEIGRVVVEAQERHQVPAAVRGWRAEARRPPPLGRRVHRRQPLEQKLARLEVAAVVVEAVHADLEAGFGQLAHGVVRRDVAAWHEVPGGAETACDLQVPQVRYVFASLLSLYVVLEHEGPALRLRPRR